MISEIISTFLKIILISVKLAKVLLLGSRHGQFAPITSEYTINSLVESAWRNLWVYLKSTLYFGIYFHLGKKRRNITHTHQEWEGYFLPTSRHKIPLTNVTIVSKVPVVNFPLVYGPMTDVPQNIKVCSHLVLGTLVI
jgi:hypothetical protein